MAPSGIAIMRPRPFWPAVLLVCGLLRPALCAAQSEAVIIDARASTTAFPHFWEQTFGSGRAILSLRESYRRDLRKVKQVTELQYVRFHAIFHDEVGIYDEDDHGKPIYNFSYVDQIYDGLLENGIRPFVEISFMPRKLAARQDIHPFWYKQVVSPAQGLRQMGRPHPPFWAASSGSLRRSGSGAMVFRGLE
jgi:xylan 1,4-beta-xylosidase